MKYAIEEGFAKEAEEKDVQEAMIPVEASHSEIHQPQVHISNNDNVPLLLPIYLHLTFDILESEIISSLINWIFFQVWTGFFCLL